MTEKANPSPNRPVDAFKTAGAIAYGGSTNGFVIDGASPTDISDQDTNIDESKLNTFAESSSGSNLTVSIDAGEAFVFGTWLAIDTATNVDLASSTNNQTVYVGWNKDTSNDVIIGKDGAFKSDPSDTDKKIPLYDFDTDASGVTAVEDRRQIGHAQDLTALAVAEDLNLPVYSDSSNAPQQEGNVIAIDGGGSQSVGLYSHDGSSYVKAGKTEEAIEDIVSGLLVGGSAISLNYDDGNNTLTINNQEPYTDEDAEDAIGAALSGGDKLSVTYDDPNDTITVDTTALDSDEVEDRVDTLLSFDNNLTSIYDDANNELTISFSDSISATDVTASGTLTIPEVTSDPASGNLWIRSDL